MSKIILISGVTLLSNCTDVGWHCRAAKWNSYVILPCFIEKKQRPSFCSLLHSKCIIFLTMQYEISKKHTFFFCLPRTRVIIGDIAWQLNTAFFKRSLTEKKIMHQGHIALKTFQNLKQILNHLKLCPLINFLGTLSFIFILSM